ncbi:MAG: hypothetical protein HY698_03150 [Deltaproteobacteria bacterium]|nr:hypothetical protein [Deltaproteobacteria bacterium]
MSTWCRNEDESPSAFFDRALRLGFGALAWDATLSPAFLAEAESELSARREDLRVLVVEGPCPAPRGRRAPRLATADKEERRAALKGLEDTLTLAARVAARVVVVKLGSLDVQTNWARLVRAFSRRSLDRSDVDALIAERARLAPLALDLARFGLDPLLHQAQEKGLSVALVNRARWFEIPADMELGVLLEDFRGAPLAPWHDPAAAHAREALGFGSAASLLAVHGKHARGAWLTDAVGLLGGLPWGRGEVDTGTVRSAISPDAILAIHVAPGVTDDELASSLTWGA